MIMMRLLGSDIVATTLAPATLLSPLVKSANIITGFGYVALACAVCAARTTGSSTVDLVDTDTAITCSRENVSGFTTVYCQSPI